MSWRFLESPSCWRRTAILCHSTCPFQQSQRRGSVAGLAKSRDGRYRRPGNYQDVSSLARGPWPHGPIRGTGAESARAVIGTSPRVRGRVRGRTGQAALSPSARAGSCAPGTSASCVRQGRKGPNETTGADVRVRLDQARRFAAAPWRELPRAGTHRGRAFASRSSAAFSRRSEARIVQSGHGPARKFL